jgi:large subunit ribosomal protein L31
MTTSVTSLPYLCRRSDADPSADFAFLSRSTLTSNKPIEWEDGNAYPLVDVSSASHPFYTGRGRVFDTAGRVERFKQRY